jgi:hypothetical protein
MLDLTKQICCFYSCFIYLTNAIIAYIYGYRNFAYLLVFLWITSIIYYSNRNSIFANVLDRTTVIFVICYSFTIFYKKCLDKKNNLAKYLYIFIVMFIFLFIIYLHYYDKICNCNHTYEKKNIYQSLLHIISSLGVNIIIIL